jgi:hypothetical protein
MLDVAPSIFNLCQEIPMAAASPFDGRPSDPPEAVSFVRSIRPPTQPHRVIQSLKRVFQIIGRVLFCLTGGGCAIAFYCMLFPFKNRSIQITPPWSDEAPTIFAVFLVFAMVTWRFSWRRKG